MDLRASQAALAETLLDAATAPAALTLFKGDPLSVARRLALYRGALDANRKKALAGAYPVLHALVGEDFFSALSDAYGAAHPSTSGDLNRFGAAFEEFLQHFPHVAAYSYFPAMARLEWQLHRVHHAPESPALDAASIAALSMQALESAQLHLRPVSRLFHAPTAVVSLWQAHQQDALVPFPDAIDRPEWAVVVRPQWRPLVLALPAAAHAVLEAVARGDCLGDALDRGMAIDAEFDFGSHLKTWLDARVFAPLDAAISA
jgi:hypothetical protein